MDSYPCADGGQGRFDHFGFDRKNQLFVAALATIPSK